MPPRLLSVTSVTSLGGNAYALTLSASLGYNNYIISIASSSTVFGPAVTDANGAGISGLWTNSSSTFPSGNGLAGSQFNFQIDVLPGDINQNGTVNSQDSGKAVALGERQDDWGHLGQLQSVRRRQRKRDDQHSGLRDSRHERQPEDVEHHQSEQPVRRFGGGGSGFTALALGVQESGQTSGSTSSGQQRQFAQLGAGHHYGRRERHGIGECRIDE